MSPQFPDDKTIICQGHFETKTGSGQTHARNGWKRAVSAQRGASWSLLRGSVHWQSRRWRVGKKRLRLSNLYLKMIFLPRQTRDKYRENSKTMIVSQVRRGRSCEVRKRHFLSKFDIKTIILPRQARDKHRTNSNKSAVFCQRPRAAGQDADHGRDALRGVEREQGWLVTETLSSF